MMLALMPLKIRPADFQVLFERSPGLLLVLNEEFTIVAATDAYLHATMTLRENIVGHNLFAAFPDNPSDPSATGAGNLRASLERAIATRQPDTMPVQKYDIRKPPEEGGGFEERYWSPVNVPVYHAGGSLAYLIHRVEDVTEAMRLTAIRESGGRERGTLEEQVARGNQELELLAELLKSERQALHALRDSEEQFRTLVNSIPQLAWMANPDGGIFWYNQRWYEYTGATPQQMAVRGWQSVHDPGELPRVLERRQSSIATGEPFEMVFPLRGRDGVFRPFLTRVRPLRNAEGEIVRWVGANTDLSGQQEAQELLRKAVAARTAELKQSLDEMESFTYSVSHDLRSPLRAIQGFAQVLLEDHAERLDGEGKECALRIKRAAERMMDLIHDLLSYSRLRQAPLDLSPVNLRKAIAQAMSQLEISPAARIEIDVPERLDVLADLTTLAQVVANLISNGLKFRPPERTPELRIESEAAEAVSEGAAETARGPVRLCVRDNGIGIAPEHQKRIFKVFERLHSSDFYPGTGVGLAIVARGIERMNGRYGVESAEGEGSEFWIELPRP